MRYFQQCFQLILQTDIVRVRITLCVSVLHSRCSVSGTRLKVSSWETNRFTKRPSPKPPCQRDNATSFVALGSGAGSLSGGGCGKGLESSDHISCTRQCGKEIAI
jgi:hypothetical protein